MQEIVGARVLRITSPPSGRQVLEELDPRPGSSLQGGDARPGAEGAAIAGYHWLGDWGRDAMIARAAANMRITPKHGVVK